MNVPDRFTLGIKANLRSFILLVLITGFIGGMLGSERTVVADIATEDFGVAKATVALSFIISFGVFKALANMFAGGLADHLGRRRVLVLGWLVALPAPLLIIFAPNWWYIVGANTLLGLSQGLTWSITIAMKMDLARADERGAAVGVNEFTGYTSIALTTLAAGGIAEAYGSRPAPFFLPTALAAAGLLAALLLVRETHDYARHESAQRNGPGEAGLPWQRVFALTSWRLPSLRSAAQAGLVIKMNDAMVWGLVPLLLDDHGLDTARIALVGAIYPATWGVFQLVMGAASDRVGRKPLIVSGMALQAMGVALFLTLEGFAPWAGAAAVMGFGTALAYPTLLATIGDVADPQWRASSVGIYRLWRDSGFAWGALATGLLADAFGFDGAIAFMALLSLGSTLYVGRYMAETLAAPAGRRETATV